MGDSLPDINVDELTDSVNIAVNGALLPPGPMLPQLLTAPLLSRPTCASFPSLPPVSSTGVPPLPIFSSIPSFPTAVPLPMQEIGPATCVHSTSAETPRNAGVDDETEISCSLIRDSAIFTATTTTCSSDDSSSTMPSSSLLPIYLPVSAPGCSPMFIMFSFQLPMPDTTPGGNKERMSTASPFSVPGPRLPPFPPPFPLLFPMLPQPPPPPQDGRSLRNLLPFPDQFPPVATESVNNGLLMPAVSFPQGLPPLPPLPLLPQLPTSTSAQGGLCLPPMMAHYVTSGSMEGLPLPPLLPPPPLSLTRNSLPTLLPHPGSCEAQCSLPLPPFPPQSFAAFVQSSLPMTSLSPSNLPSLPPLLASAVTPMSDGNLPPVTTMACSKEHCQTSVAFSSLPTSLTPNSLPLPSFAPMTLPPLPPLSSHMESCLSNCLPPPLPLPPPLSGQFFPPLPFMPGAPPPPDFLSQLPGGMLADRDCVRHSPSVCFHCQNREGVSQQNEGHLRVSGSEPSTSCQVCLDQGAQGHENADAQIPVSYATGASSGMSGTVPTSLGISGTVPPDTSNDVLCQECQCQMMRCLENAMHLYTTSAPGGLPVSVPSFSCPACQQQMQKRLDSADGHNHKSYAIASSSAPGSVESEDTQQSCSSHGSDVTQASRKNKDQQQPQAPAQNLANSQTLPHTVTAACRRTLSSIEEQDVSNSNSCESHASHMSSISAPCSSAAGISHHDSSYLQLSNAISCSQSEHSSTSSQSFKTQFSEGSTTPLLHHLTHPQSTNKNGDLHDELDDVPGFLYSLGESRTPSQLIPDERLTMENGNQGLNQQIFSSSFHSPSSSACSQAQYINTGGSHDVGHITTLAHVAIGTVNSSGGCMHKGVHQNRMEFSGSDESLVHLVTVGGDQVLRNRALSSLQALDTAGVSRDIFSLTPLPVTDHNQDEGLLHQDLPELQALQDDHHSDSGILPDQLRSCQVDGHAMRGHPLHHSSQDSSRLISALSDHHHPNLAEIDPTQIDPTFTTLSESSVQSSHLTVSGTASMDVDCAGLDSSTDPAYQFQSGLTTEFNPLVHISTRAVYSTVGCIHKGVNFEPACTPQVSMGREDPALLPGVGYSPPGLSNQGLSPHMFGSGELGSTEQQQTQNLQTMGSDATEGGLGLANMSATVLDMLLKDDLPVHRTLGEADTLSDQNTTGEPDQPVPAFTGQFCVECNKMYEEGCQHHSTQYRQVSDTPALTRAQASLPTCLKLGQSNITGHFNNTGVFAKEVVPAKTEFGPLQGKQIEQSSDTMDTGSFTKWKIFYEGSVKALDISDEHESNWLMFLKPARNSMERNVLAYQRGHHVAYITCRDIEPETELLFWFSTDYCKMLGLTSKRQTAASEHCPYCSLCGSVFYDHTQLRQHTLQQHKGTTTPKSYCTVCSAAFKSTAKLNAHVCSSEADNRAHVCMVCGKDFSCASNLKKHKLLHTGTKKFQCDICGQNFTQKAHLNSHQITHSGAKTAQCRYCGKRFNRSTDMRQHELQHTKEQTYKCSQCSKTFHRSVLLRRHMKVHNNERNYMCEWCSKAFYTKYHLTRHGWTCKWAKDIVKRAPPPPQQRKQQQQQQSRKQSSASSVPTSNTASSASVNVILASVSDSNQTVHVGQMPLTLGLTVTSIQCHS